MSRIRQFLQSSIGAKVAMAVSGLLIFLWVIGHMLGNLLVFAGRDALNAYAHGLREMGAILWIVRIGLLVLFVIHIVSAYQVWSRSRAARPQEYSEYSPIWATYAGRTMMLTGVLVLLYVIYHLAHFTWGVTNPEYWTLFDPKGRPDVYSMVIRGFSNVVVSLAYMAAMVLLGFHLSHGVSSLFQTLGLNHPHYNPFLRRLGPVCGVVIAAGFLAVPAAVLAGWVKLP